MEASVALATVQRTELNRERVELLKRTLCKGASDDELTMFVETAKRLQLDPFARQVFAVKRWDSKERREVMAIQVSIDGFRLVAERTGKYAGQLGPFWTADGKEWVEVWLNKNPPAAAKVAVLRSDFKEPLWGVATWEQYKQTKNDGGLTSMWSKMGPLMLAKCAESLALRRAFPNELSGVYTQEEMAQATPESPEYTPPANAPTAADRTATSGSAATSAASVRDAATSTSDSSSAPVVKANTIKHDGNFITPAQLQKLHVTRKQAGGVWCGDDDNERSEWRMKVLGVYRDQRGERITSSKQLSRDQASHLIDRLTAYIAKTTQRAQQMAEDVRTVSGLDTAAPPADILSLEMKRKGVAEADLREYVLAPYGADSVEDLDEADKAGALALLLAYTQGLEPYVATMQKLGFRTEGLV